jgi:hypothetical protein
LRNNSEAGGYGAKRHPFRQRASNFKDLGIIVMTTSESTPGQPDDELPMKVKCMILDEDLVPSLFANGEEIDEERLLN